MFKVERSSDDRLDIQMSGKLDNEGMLKALDELVENPKASVTENMLYEVVDYHPPSLGAIGIELSRIPEMSGFIKKFSRAAVLSDKAWLKTISELEGKLMPGLEIRKFSREQKSEAVEWLESK
jgi:hypothetical protein